VTLYERNAECLKRGAMRSIVLMFNSDWLEENPHAAEVFNEANAVKAANSNR
jgi:hypothetical protein